MMVGASCDIFAIGVLVSTNNCNIMCENPGTYSFSFFEKFLVVQNLKIASSMFIFSKLFD